MHESSTTFWPYEQRFELLTAASLLNLSDEIWHRVVELAGAKIVKQGRSPSCRHFVLSMSSLLVFDRRLVLLSCVPGGIAEAADYLMTCLHSYGVIHATLERRLPLGRFVHTPIPPLRRVELLPDASSTGEASIVHTWPLPPITSRRATLALLMHELHGSGMLETAKVLIGKTFSSLLFSGFEFDGGGFSYNAVGGDDYITFHYSPHCYASLEASFASQQEWELMGTILDQTLLSLHPEVVAPAWYGSSAEHCMVLAALGER